MRTTQAGLTLLELIVALAILGIVLALAAPSFSAIAESGRFAGASHQLSVSLATARTLSITRGQRVSVCPLATGNRCTGGSDWTRGWMVFLDPDRAGQPKDDDAIVQVFERGPGNTSLRVGTTPGRRLVRFSPDGMAGGSNLTLSICADGEDRLLGQVVVSMSGRARSTRLASGATTACPLGPPPG